MSVKMKNPEGSLQRMTVVDKTEEGVKVLIPSLDVPLEMTNAYFEHLQKTGTYIISYDINKAS